MRAGPADTITGGVVLSSNTGQATVARAWRETTASARNARWRTSGSRAGRQGREGETFFFFLQTGPSPPAAAASARPSTPLRRGSREAAGGRRGAATGREPVGAAARRERWRFASAPGLPPVCSEAARGSRRRSRTLALDGRPRERWRARWRRRQRERPGGAVAARGGALRPSEFFQ